MSKFTKNELVKLTILTFDSSNPITYTGKIQQRLSPAVTDDGPVYIVDIDQIENCQFAVYEHELEKLPMGSA